MSSFLVAAIASAVASAAPCDAKLDEANVKVRALQLRAKNKEAFALLSSMKAECFASLAPHRQAWLVSDMALLAHKRGDDKMCLAVLKDAPALEPGAVVARALAFNTGLCGGGCAEKPDACEGVERGLVRRRAEIGDKSFTTAPCSIGSFAGAVAVNPFSGSGSACLALVPAAADGARWRCPKLAVIERNDRGQLKRRELPFPAAADAQVAVVDERECCNIADLATRSGTGTASTTTWLRVRGAGKSCVDDSGFGDFDETFRFDGTTLVLDRLDDVR